MPNHRRLSTEEKIINLERRSSEQLLKARKREVNAVMEAHPSCIPHVLSKLESLGLRTNKTDQTGSAPKEPPTPPSL